MRANCLTCENQRYSITVHGDWAVAALCRDCSSVCPRCQNERSVARIDGRGYEVLEPCGECQPLLTRVQRFNQARLPARHAHCRLRDYVDNGGNQREILQRVHDHVHAYRPGARGLLLSGKVGTGKTHLMVAMLGYLTLEAAVRARFIEFTHLLSDIKEGFNAGRNETEVLGPVTKIPVLGIDELGKGLSTEWQLSILDEIISRRYNQGLTTYFTTNLALSDAAPRTGEGYSTSSDLRRSLESVSLVDRVGDRIYSRLHEMCELMTVDGPDHRRPGR